MLVKSNADLLEMVKHLADCPVFAFDTETTALRWWPQQMVGLSFYGADSKGNRRGFYAPTLTDEERAAVLMAVAPFLTSPTQRKVAHNLKFDWKVLRRHGADLSGPYDDTILMAHLLNEEQSKALKSLAQTVLGYSEVTLLKDVMGKKESILDVDEERLASYGEDDAKYTFELWEHWKDALEPEKLTACYERVELPMVEVLVDVETAGVVLDTGLLADMGVRMRQELALAVAKVYELAGGEFSISSTKQLGDVLFGKLGLPVLETTGKGVPSTKAWVLDELANKGYPIARVLRKYRELSKLLGTYVEGLPAFVDPDGRLRCSFNQTGAATGRLSSSEPNLQNQPARNTDWPIRRAYVAAPGHKLVVADYSQIELRVIAHLSKDPLMVKMFKEGGDIHQATADEMGISRQDAKSANFAYAYGAWGDYRDRYFEKFPGIRAWQHGQETFLAKYGFVRTMTGRKRRIGLPVSGTSKEARSQRGAQHRLAYNSSIQGSAADIIKLAMIDVNRRVKEYGGRLLITVHDELILEAPKAEAVDVARVVKDAMEGAVTLSVPLLAEPAIADNWYEGKG